MIGSDPFFIAMFQPLDDLIQGHGDGAEDQNEDDQNVKLEETISVKDMDIYLADERNQKRVIYLFHYNTKPPETQAERHRFLRIC